MTKIAVYDERLMEKDVFRFPGSHPVPFPVFVTIGIVPLKPGAIVQGIHCHIFSIRLSYTSTTPAIELPSA
jgi:hypothetical protein